MNITANITTIKGIGDKTAALFGKLGIFTVEDLLHYYPRGYEKYNPPVEISELKDGVNAFYGVVKERAIIKKVKNLTITTATAQDKSGKIRLSFFNMPYIANVIKPGETYIFYGMVRDTSKPTMNCEHPKIFKPEDYLKRMQSLYPVYTLTKGLNNNTITKALSQVLTPELAVDELLPSEIRERYHLIAIKEAIWNIHFPIEENIAIMARHRIIFEEFFIFFLSICNLKGSNKQIVSPYPMIESAEIVRFIEQLPFRLTNAQNKVWNEVKTELTGTYAMNRLIQGDVGSGKTIIAILAILLTATNGFQSAMMAPTEVLANQHFEYVIMLKKQYNLPLNPILLTGSMSAKEKNKVRKMIENKEVNVVFGTHTLIQDSVNFNNLALVITDEQHRFGVRQRESFAGKGINTHVLVMSATPIPRSLAMILYGDMNLSVMNELPNNRLPIKNCVVDVNYRKKAYEFMENEIRQGHQIYIICPMVDEGEMEDLENVLEYKKKLRLVFPEAIRIETLHGKMKPSEKNNIMNHFSKGNIDILISTTVIEVGINVPNATVMMIENAERFGLAQLHQLRGRVGRGESQSYCIFVSGNNSQTNMDRLAILNHSNDGFKIAEEDLKLRGPGDLFGIRQSGVMGFKIADILLDSNILQEASQEVDRILLSDPDFTMPEHSMLRDLVNRQALLQVDFRTI